MFLFLFLESVKSSAVTPTVGQLWTGGLLTSEVGNVSEAEHFYGPLLSCFHSFIVF